MAIYALADLHLALAIPEKSMEFFGEPWARYTERIEDSWKSLVKPDDLVLVAGDISWAKRELEASVDLNWIDKLPGTKLLLKGNHDYWWSSLSQVRKLLPPSMKVIQNDTFEWHGFSIGGSRLWDTKEYNFSKYVQMVENPRANKLHELEDPEEQERIFLRELHRLELSLKALKPSSKKIAMTHYPPIGPEMLPSRASKLLEKYGVETCVFGHLHNVRRDIPIFGTSNGVQYILTAGDYLQFVPKLIFET
jgi:predicted phosphohydrolase